MSTQNEPQNKVKSSPVEWVDLHGDALFGYAYLRVRDREIAEDLVQECFVAALASRDQFSGQSSERTWLVGILKHKIIDYFRSTPDTTRDDPGESTEQLAFNDKGFWRIRLGKWPRDPQALLENQEFWETVRRCLGRLPKRLAEVFTLREIDDRSSEEICQVLGLSSTNLWARLHRARIGLRHCLDTHWFQR